MQRRSLQTKWQRMPGQELKSSWWCKLWWMIDKNELKEDNKKKEKILYSNVMRQVLLFREKVTLQLDFGKRNREINLVMKLPFVVLMSQSVSHTFWSCLGANLGAKIQLFPDREKEERDSSTSGWSTTGYKEMLDDEEWKENEGDSSLFSSHPSEKSSYSWSKCLPHSLTSSSWTWDLLLSLSFFKKRKGREERKRGKVWKERVRRRRQGNRRWKITTVVVSRDKSGPKQVDEWWVMTVVRRPYLVLQIHFHPTAFRPRMPSDAAKSVL